MRKARSDTPEQVADELAPEYRFDYRAALPNRFAPQMAVGSRLVVLEPDVASVFTSAEQVNTVLRALIEAMQSVPRE